MVYHPTVGEGRGHHKFEGKKCDKPRGGNRLVSDKPGSGDITHSDNPRAAVGCIPSDTPPGMEMK